MRFPRQPALLALAGALALAIPFLQDEEGLVTGVYKDVVGVQTWCYGDTGPVPDEPLTRHLCDEQLTKRTEELCRPIAARITVPVTVHELAAICSWTYNVGQTAARNSTLLKRLNSGDYAATAEQFLRWKYAGGKDCSVRTSGCYGVWARRLKERDLFLGKWSSP